MMNINHSAEISLRCAIFNAKKNHSQGDDLADKIKHNAMSNLDLIHQAEGLFNGVLSNSSVQAAAISAAIQGIALAYQAINSELSEARYKRKRFVEECETHLASFSISATKELNELSQEELAIKKFYEMIQKLCPNIIDYFGVNVHKSKEINEEFYYAALPFYRMSLSLQQNGVIANKIDAHRQAIFLFLKTGLPVSIYYDKFKKYSRIWLQIQALFNAYNYLNHLKAPRFILSALANLLWNLQHPVNPDTGIPLSLDECVSVCHRASMFLNELLNPSQFSYLQTIDDSKKTLQQALYSIELLIKSLQNAFEYDSLHEINLVDISKHTHSAIRIMANKLLELIYKHENAAEKLVGQIMIMGEMLMQNHDLYNYFHQLQEKFNPKFTNPTARTLIDVLNLFAHQTPQKRKMIGQQMINSGCEAHIQFAYQLLTFNQNFLDKFEKIIIGNLKIHHCEQKITYRKTATHFIPLTLLVMESFTVFRDTRPKKIEHIESENSLYDLQNTTHDKKQRNDILNDAASQTDDHYYNWSLSKFLNVESSFHTSLDMLLSYHNKMRLNTIEIDIASFQVSENRALLLNKNFKKKLLDTLNNTFAFYSDLSNRFNDVESHMLYDMSLQREQKRILQPMLDDLSAIIQSIQKSITTVNSIISSDSFEQEERERQQEKIGLASMSMDETNFLARSIILSPKRKSTPNFFIPEEEILPPKQEFLSQKFLINLGLGNILVLGLLFLVNSLVPLFAINCYLSLIIALVLVTSSTGYFYHTNKKTPENPLLSI